MNDARPEPPLRAMRRRAARGPGRWTGRGVQAFLAAGLILALEPVAPAAAQDMMQHVDLASPEMTSAEMTRSDVEAAIAAAAPRGPVDLTGRRLSGLDLSGLDLS
ncbi:MAG TPA: hypothetical protein VGF60_01190, partial [Xanthobacteraceae bacterium]